MRKGHFWRWLPLVMSALVACGEDDPAVAESSDVGGASDVLPDAAPDGASPDAGAVDYCGGGVACRTNASCRRDVSEDHVCNADGCCEPGPPRIPTPCSFATQVCSLSSDSSRLLVCDTLERMCLPRCSVEAFNNGDPNYCPSGMRCEPVSERSYPFDDRTGLVLEGLCRPHQCARNFDPRGSLDEAECDGLVADGTPDRCGLRDDCTCVTSSNQHRVCVLQGAGETGAACDDTGDCGSGLQCMTGVCLPYCDLAADSCDPDPATCPSRADCTCVPLEYELNVAADGVCSVPCTAYSEGECPAGSLCRFLATNAATGNGTYACIPLLSSSSRVLSEGEACQPSATSERGDVCAEGLICEPGTGIRGGASCVRVCALGGEDGAGSCPDPALQVCVPISTTYFGVCLQRCDLFAGGSSGCPETQACTPDYSENVRVPSGFCSGVSVSGELGDACDYLPTTPRPGCADGLQCHLPPRSTAGTCLRRCDVFAEDPGCPQGQVCDGGFALLAGGVSACVEPPNSGEIGDACTVSIGACAANGSVCASEDSRTSQCFSVCRVDEPTDCSPPLSCQRFLPAWSFTQNLGACAGGG